MAHYAFRSATFILLLLAGCGGSRMAPRTVPQGGSITLPAACLAEPQDSDGDGIPDACELQLVTEFAPMLMLPTLRCTPPPLQPRAEIPGGYFHAVQPLRDVVRILYLPAYYRDCGWSGAKCLLVDCTPHAGDSELIAVDVRPDEGGWRVERIFLSAHCFGRTRGDCRWYEGDELEAFEWVVRPRGAPVVWVSEGRQANYPTRAACRRGHWGFDDCGADAEPVRFLVLAGRNIGSREVPLREPDRRAGCVSGLSVEPMESLLVGTQEIECFWDPQARFRGWQGGPDRGATAYGRYLETLGL